MNTIFALSSSRQRVLMPKPSYQYVFASAKLITSAGLKRAPVSITIRPSEQQQGSMGDPSATYGRCQMLDAGDDRDVQVVLGRINTMTVFLSSSILNTADGIEAREEAPDPRLVSQRCRALELYPRCVEGAWKNMQERGQPGTKRGSTNWRPSGTKRYFPWR